MKATEGNGGAPIVLHKGEVEKPEIPRGLMQVPKENAIGPHTPGCATFIYEIGEFVLTYYDVVLLGIDGEFFVCRSDADTVVTWERRT